MQRWPTDTQRKKQMGYSSCIIKVIDSKGSLIDEVNWKFNVNETLLDAVTRFRHENGKKYNVDAQFIAQYEEACTCL